MKNTIKYIVVILAFMAVSCVDDFLDRPPQDQLTIDMFYNSPEELRMATNALYNVVWFDWHDKAKMGIGEGAGGNYLTNDGEFRIFFQFSVTGEHARMTEAWRSLFNVVAQSNMVIYGVSNADSDNITQADKNRALAEARFMRAASYLQIVTTWGAVPIIEDNLAFVEDYVIPRNRVEDIYEFIIRDLEFADEHLSETSPAGRLTKWSAKGMLARVHLYAAGVGQSGSRDATHLSKAREYAEAVINESGLNLMPDYADLFRVENDNNPESLFALQWVDKGAGWGVQNTLQAYLAPEGRIAGVGDGWGGSTGASYDLQQLYQEGDQRRKPTIMFYGDHYPELMREEGGYHYELKSFAGSAVKKYVIGGPNDVDVTVSFMSTPQNTYMLRLAEVYLIAAEAILGNNASTSDGDALAYYNAVRERAGLDPQNVITFDDIFREKRIELAFEGRLWYELVRWHYFAPAAAINYISNQNRGHFSWDEENWYVDPENDLFIVPTDDHFTMPFPSAEVSRNPLLLEEPVAYNFSN